jgi:GTPase SAR1 family protein
MIKFKKGDKNTNYVFVFGSVGTGKSTLIAALLNLFSKTVKVVLNRDNTRGSAIFTNYISFLSDGKFPPRTLTGEFLEIDFAYYDSFNNAIPVTIVETSGEDLARIDVSRSTFNNDSVSYVKDYLLKYIEKSAIFIVVVDVGNANKDDMLTWQFLQYISEIADYPKVAIVVNKWDLIKKPDLSLESFFSSEMPLSYRYILADQDIDVTVFKHSIGEITYTSEKDFGSNAIPVINRIDTVHTKKIANWLYQVSDEMTVK